MPDIIDLRSDTVTKPTPQMRRAMAEAEVGDDVYGEDPTVRRLEELAADLLGKEAGLLVTSGTQGNQVAVAAQVHTGDEVIAEADSHIFYYESAAVSALAGAQIRQVPGFRGVMSPKSVLASIRELPNDHHPRTALIAIENTHNRAGGTVVPLENLEAVRRIAVEHKIPIHMDGARLFNAVVASGQSAKAFAACVDTVQFCLSKGLCAPVGSVVVGSKAFIDEARRWRKRLGGGMRQAGIIAAPGIIALTDMVERLADDHANARLLAEGLSQIPGLSVDLDTVQTNIVIVEVNVANLEVPVFLSTLKQQGVLATSFGSNRVRFVTHHDVSRSQVTAAIDAVHAVVKGSR